MADGSVMIVGKLILTLGGLLAFCVWQFLDLRRDRPGSGEDPVKARRSRSARHNPPR